MNQCASFVQPDVLEKNMTVIHNFLMGSYTEVKKQVESGTSFLKEEFSAFSYETGQCINRMLLPVNNFIKGKEEIDKELLKEMSIASPDYLAMDGKMVPVEKVLAGPMEEN
jgi:hypothetical protein